MNLPSQPGTRFLVTGAGGALGSAISRALAGPSVCLTLVDRDEASLEAVAADAEAFGASVIKVSADVGDEAQVRRYVDLAAGESGNIDGFANNAGIEGPVVPLVEYAAEDFDSVLRVNVRGVFLGLKHVAQRMSSGSAIVNTASTGGLVGALNLAGYIASKHAVVGLTRAAAIELAPRGIRVNAVCPGPIKGRMMASIASGLGAPDLDAVSASKVPLGRPADADEVAAVVAFLLGDRSSYMTGAAVPVDGGRSS
jgi:NAD(P)-dependent dehydrogenase (short-subunit alcohol dehydrogenase family)